MAVNWHAIIGFLAVFWRSPRDAAALKLAGDLADFEAYCAAYPRLAQLEADCAAFVQLAVPAAAPASASIEASPPYVAPARQSPADFNARSAK